MAVDVTQPLGENPLIEGLERLPVPATTLTIFGVTGDLAHRKLLPALYNLAHEGALPERFNLVGVARHLPEVVVGHVAPRDPEQVEALWQRPLVGEVVERREQLAVRQIARGAEDHQRRGRDRQPFEPLDERVLLDLVGDGRGHGASSPRPARPRARRTGCATPPARGACSRPRRASRSARTATRP